MKLMCSFDKLPILTPENDYGTYLSTLLYDFVLRNVGVSLCNLFNIVIRIHEYLYYVDGLLIHKNDGN